MFNDPPISGGRSTQTTERPASTATKYTGTFPDLIVHSGQKIASTAIDLAYPKGTAKKTYTYGKGHARLSFTKAISLMIHRFQEVVQPENYLTHTHREAYQYDEEALKDATDTTEDLLRTERAISDSKRTNRLSLKTKEGANNTGVVGDRFSRQFINQGYVNFRGTKVRGIEDLAEAMQVYRDPRFETFRIVFMRGKKIVAVDGVSAKMPNFYYCYCW